MKKIKAIIFDVGNVIINYNSLRIAKKLSKILNVSAFKLFKVALSDKSKLMAKYHKGMHSKDFWNETSKKLGIKRVNQRKIGREWCEMFSLNKHVFQLLSKLKKHYKLVLLSNAIKVHSDYIFRKYKLKRFFSLLILSYKVKTRKPETKIFKLALKRLNAKPSEIIFIDDKREFVSAARKLNINAIQFRNFKKLKKDLKRLGVEV